jgi:esterase/lipase
MQVFRTKFKGEIVTEFVVPNKQTNKVIILCTGMPAYPERVKYKDLFDFYARKGFWVFVPRYRGSWESGGKMFQKSPHVDVKDVIDGLSLGFRELWDGKEFKIENPEVYLVGGSFGGTAVLLNSNDVRVKKVIALSPVTDWATAKDTEEPIEWIVSFVHEGFGEGYRIAKDGWEKIKSGTFFNPSSEIDKIDGKKCLIIHAKDDHSISLDSVASFAKVTDSKLTLLSKEGHMGASDLMNKKVKDKCFNFLKSK